MPALVLTGDCPARDHVVNVGVVLEHTSPAMEHTKEARQIGADELRVGSELFHSQRGSGKQGRVGRALVAADKETDLFRHGESDQEVMSGQLPAHLTLQPQAAFPVLALGAVTVAAAAGQYMGPGARLTAVDGRSACFSAALDDSGDDLFVLPWHGVAVAAQILGAKARKISLIVVMVQALHHVID